MQQGVLLLSCLPVHGNLLFPFAHGAHLQVPHLHIDIRPAAQVNPQEIPRFSPIPYFFTQVLRISYPALCGRDIPDKHGVFRRKRCTKGDLQVVESLGTEIIKRQYLVVNG